MEELKDMQYLCPNCLAQRSLNEVLFQRNVIRQVPDLQQCRLQLRLRPGTALQQTSHAVADWRQYPAQNRTVSNGVLVSLKDYNGDILNKRICPECHYPLINSTDPVSCLLSWGSKGVEYDLCDKMITLAAEDEAWEINEQDGPAGENILTYRSIISDNGRAVYFPVGLKDGDPVFSRMIIERFVHRANQAVVWLDLDCITESVYTVEAYADEAGASHFQLERPTVYMLETGKRPISDRDSLQSFLEESAQVLLNTIQVLSGQYGLVLPWNERCCRESAVQAAEWISDMLSREEAR